MICVLQIKRRQNMHEILWEQFTYTVKFTRTGEETNKYLDYDS